MNEIEKTPEYYAAHMLVEIFFGDQETKVYEIYRKGGQIAWSFNPSTWRIAVFVDRLHRTVDVEAQEHGMTGYLHDFNVLQMREIAKDCPPPEAVKIALLKFFNP